MLDKHAGNTTHVYLDLQMVIEKSQPGSYLKVGLFLCFKGLVYEFQSIINNGFDKENTYKHSQGM